MMQLQSQLECSLGLAEPVKELPEWTDKLDILVPYEESDHNKPDPLSDGWSEAIREAFQANLETGRLYWREDRPAYHFNREADYKRYITRYAGKEAGGLNPDTGRWMIRFTFKGKNRNLRRSHLIFFMDRGFWPTTLVDHINNDESDDRSINLRLRSTRGNGHNRTDQSSMGIGVSPHKQGYKATIKIENRKITIGTYRTIRGAQATYDLAFMLITPEAHLGPNGTKRSDWADAELLARSERLVAPVAEKVVSYKGVYWNKQCSKWAAQPWHEGRMRYLGSFSCPEQALEAVNDFWVSVDLPDRVQQP